MAAYLGNGPVVFDQAAEESGAVFSGTVDLNVYGGQ